jgi:hypothetical protein
MTSGKHHSRHGDLQFLVAVLVLLCRLKLADGERKLTRWRGPKSFILGNSPASRDCHGLATISEHLYVFGGNSGTGGNTYRDVYREFEKNQQLSNSNIALETLFKA